MNREQKDQDLSVNRLNRITVDEFYSSAHSFLNALVVFCFVLKAMWITLLEIVLLIQIIVVSLIYQKRKIMTTQKITLATIKKFVKENANNLYAKCTSSFDGMTDCVENRKEGFVKVDPTKIDLKKEQDLGIERLWFVRGSRDYFSRYNEAGLNGFVISNSCGSSIIATYEK